MHLLARGNVRASIVDLIKHQKTAALVFSLIENATGNCIDPFGLEKFLFRLYSSQSVNTAA